MQLQYQKILLWNIITTIQVTFLVDKSELNNITLKPIQIPLYTIHKCMQCQWLQLKFLHKTRRNLGYNGWTD